MKNLNILPTSLLQAAVGQLLGDRYADKSSPTSNTRLSWSFGSNYETYANFISNLFRPYCRKGVYPVTVKAKKDGKYYNNYRLKTASLSVFNILHTMFYVLDPTTNKYVKVIPQNIDILMSPITLAHLIMGDGGYHKERKQVRIFTYNYTYQDCLRLADSIKKIGIKVSVVFDRVGSTGELQYILNIGSLELENLQKMVLKHMPESMHYRVGVKLNL